MPSGPIFKLLRAITVSASARMVMVRRGFRPLCTTSLPPLKSSVTASSMSVTKIPTRATRFSKSPCFSSRLLTLASIRPPSIEENALGSWSAYSTSCRSSSADFSFRRAIRRVELLGGDFLPPGVRRGDDEVALLRVAGAAHRDVARLAVVKVHDDALRVREVLVGLSLDHKAHGPLPALPRLLVNARLVDLVLERRGPLAGKSLERHENLLTDRPLQARRLQAYDSGMAAPNGFYEPITARDAWFLYAERPETPLDLGTVYVFESGSRVPGGRGAAGIESAISERLHLVPRYREKIRRVAFYL